MASSYTPLREVPYSSDAVSTGILPYISFLTLLWGVYFSPKMQKILKTAIFTLGMNILTTTRVKNVDGILMEVLVNIGEYDEN